MPNDAQGNDVPADQEPIETEDLSDMPPLIDSEPNLNLPLPQVYVQYWANAPHHAPVIISVSYITDNGVWVVLPAVQNDPAQLPVRMITDNIGEQFRRNSN